MISSPKATHLRCPGTKGNLRMRAFRQLVIKYYFNLISEWIEKRKNNLIRVLTFSRRINPVTTGIDRFWLGKPQYGSTHSWLSHSFNHSWIDWDFDFDWFSFLRMQLFFSIATDVISKMHNWTNPQPPNSSSSCHPPDCQIRFFVGHCTRAKLRKESRNQTNLLLWPHRHHIANVTENEWIIIILIINAVSTVRSGIVQR